MSTFIIFSKIYSLEKYQIAHKIIAKKISKKRVWEAILFTIFLFFAQTYCAIKIVQAIEKPLHREIMKKIIGKLAETQATASFEMLQIQYASTKLYDAWSKFHIKIGIDK